MKCVICKNGTTTHGITNVTLEKDAMIFILKEVPAEICSTCGEIYIDEAVSRNIQKLAGTAYKEGIQLEICSYKVA